jgi:outer membrane protein assembly factor BamB
VSEFPTVFDGYGRHAISPNGKLYVAANWRKGKNAGVACYDTRTGERIWHREDLRQVQGIRFSAQGDKVWCRVEARPVHCLDSGTGSILAKLRNVDDVVESSYSDLVLHSRRRTDYLIVGHKKKAFPRLSASMSDAVFSTDSLGLAEYVGPVRCLDCESGQERWRYVPPQGFHVITLSYQPDESFYGYLFGYASPRAALLRFSPSDGACTELCRYDLSERYGGDFGEGVFVAGTGEVLSLVDGQVLRQLAFQTQISSA